MTAERFGTTAREFDESREQAERDGPIHNSDIGVVYGTQALAR
jgi:hypothetical protein